MRRTRAAAALVLSALAAPALAQAPQRGGTLDFGVVFEPPTYDCHAGNTFAVLHAVSPHYSTLLKFDLKHYPKVTGDLAETWSVSDDKKTYTFKLKPNVKFHDGSTLTAADVKASYDRLRDPPAGVVSIRKALFSDIAAIDTPDAATVVFRLKDVNAAMETMFALPWNCIYSAAKLKEDPAFPTKTVMGTGPFRFVEHVKGSHWVGQRFDGYHVPGQPYLDGFRATFIPNPSAMLNALQGGAVKAEFRGLTPNERDRLVEALGPKVRSEESSEPTVLLITFNTEKKPFDDVRVRRALTMAIDRRAASEGLYKQSRLKTVGGLMRPGSPFATPERELEKFPGLGRDVEAARAEAKRLLKEAGVENLSFVLTNRNNPPYTTTGIYALDQWKRIGVNAEHRPVETAAWTQALTSGNFDVIVDFGSDVVDEPSLRLAKHISTDRSPQNAARVVDRELDSLYDRQASESDPAKRADLVRAFEARWLDQAASVPFLWAQRIVVTYADVHGWAMSPSNSLGQDLAEVWLAK
jgi:peptide/nickel transport system substrate-binding protein